MAIETGDRRDRPASICTSSFPLLATSSTASLTISFTCLRIASANSSRCERERIAGAAGSKIRSTHKTRASLRRPAATEIVRFFPVGMVHFNNRRLGEDVNALERRTSNGVNDSILFNR